MNMHRLIYRAVQALLRAVRPFVPFKFPTLVSGEGSLQETSIWVKHLKLHHVLVVTDAGLMKTPYAQSLLDNLKQADIQVSVYDQTQANPSIENVEEALRLYHASHCDGLIAFGGGSPMDCAKALNARLARPNTSLRQMRGLLRVLRRGVPLIAIPTTAGTGSETTVAAVVSDPSRREKYAISDPHLLPSVAILDPLLLKTVPPRLSAATGMDALTHAIEAYLGQSNTFETKGLALEAVHLIYQHLVLSIEEPEVMIHKLKMQKAAFLAGKAFTQAYVGYVHAIAHSLGAFYNVPHGIANALILPIVLRAYGDSVTVKLSELAKVAGLASGINERDNAMRLIESIETLNQRLNLPKKITGMLDQDVDALVNHAYHEAHPIYPVPRFFSKSELKSLYLQIKA